MMNYIWAGMMLFSFVSAAFFGNMQNLSDAVLSGASDAVELSISLLGMLCLWGGIMNVAQKSGFTVIISRMLSPVFKLVFKNVKKDSPAAQAISMNFTANLLGLGNAATPLGLEAIKRLQLDNPSKIAATDDMAVFVVMNSAAMRIIPTTVAALRSKYQSASPMEIMPATWICTALSLFVGITVAKLLGKFLTLSERKKQ
ncbi:MAG: spore maturation protein A [Clostridia bacterium]|nr:spore maturation protein A [Clostridia bacterium]